VCVCVSVVVETFSFNEFCVNEKRKNQNLWSWKRKHLSMSTRVQGMYSLENR
jgi:hypothetical protein